MIKAQEEGMMNFVPTRSSYLVPLSNRFKPVKGHIKINFGVEKPIKGLMILHLMKTKSKSK